MRPESRRATISAASSGVAASSASRLKIQSLAQASSPNRFCGPYPGQGLKITRAPWRSATAQVSSREPLSTTTTSSAKAETLSIAAPIRSASSHAIIKTEIEGPIGIPFSLSPARHRWRSGRGDSPDARFPSLRDRSNRACVFTVPTRGRTGSRRRAASDVPRARISDFGAESRQILTGGK